MLDMNQKHRQWLATEVSESIKYILDTGHLQWAAGVCKHVYFALVQYQPTGLLQSRHACKPQQPMASASVRVHVMLDMRMF